MKKLYFLAVSFIALSSFLKAQTYNNNTATITVDGVQRIGSCGFNTQPGVIMNTITVPISGTIVDPSKVTINISVNAPWLGDVVVELVSPQGEAITLIRRLGATTNSSCGDSSSFIAANTLSFNSANNSPINVATPLFGEPIPPGNYAPSYGTALFPKHHPGLMSTFLNDKALNGEWRLYIYDYGLGEVSNIQSWQIIVATGATLKTKEAGVFGSEISLKQNPVQDQLLVNVKDDFKTLSLAIYDGSGKMVKNENVLRSAKDFEVDVRYLTPGVYLIVPTKDGERLQTIKFIKK